MSKTWIIESIAELRRTGQVNLADQLDAARKSGNLFGMVTKTHLVKEGDELINATIKDPEYLFKSWDQIGLNKF